MNSPTLPCWATVAHLTALRTRARAPFRFYWLSGNGTSCGVSRTEAGAWSAARRSVNRDARACGGPAPWLHVGALAALWSEL